MIIIGEKINATIPKVKNAILERDEAFLRDLAARQEAAGAGLIDINVGTGEGSADDEVRNMRWLVELVGDSVNCGICVDSDNAAVLAAGIEAGGDKVGMLNSVKGTEKGMAEVMPLAAKYKMPVIALAMDDKGIPADAGSRLDICDKLMDGAAKYGVSADNMYIDPLVMPLSTDVRQGNVTLDTLAGIKRNHPRARTVLAVSNASFGLPLRSLVNSSLVSIAMFLDIDALLINPLDRGLMGSILASHVVVGKDRHCRKYTRAARGGKI